MNVRELELKGVFELTPRIFDDDRGYFLETFNKDIFKKNVCNLTDSFFQDNESYSKKHTFRGIHYQKKPYEQGKLVRVSDGKILDFAIDLRPKSNTYLEHVVLEICSTRKNQIWVPKGFGHAFLVLSDEATVCYKATDPYNKESEISINFSDTDINLGLEKYCPPEQMIVSSKDKCGIFIKNKNFD